MMKKKLTALFLALVMICSLLPADARAAMVAGVDYTLSDGVLTILKDACYPAELPIDKTAVTSIVIGSGVNAAVTSDDPELAGQFSGFTNLASFRVEAGNTLYFTQDDVLFASGGSGWILMCYPAQKAGSVYEIPNSVTQIIDSAFDDAPAALTLYASAAVMEAVGNDYNNRVAAHKIQSYASENTVPVESILLLDSSLTLAVGASAALSVEVYGSDLSTPTISAVTWTSSDPAVASVDAAGKVTALTPGTATITATTVGLSENNEHLSASCDVTVDTPVSSMTIPDGTPGADGDVIAIDTAASSPTVLSVEINADATSRGVTWTVSDASVAALSNDGAASTSVTVRADGTSNRSSVTVAPRSSGDVTVTASAGTASKTFTLRLSRWVTSASLDQGELYLAVGGGRTLVLTQDGEAPAVEWSTDNASVVSVSNGTLTALAPGDATVSVAVTSGSGSRTHTETASCAVHVRGIVLSSASLELTHHDTAVLTASTSPAGKAFVWESLAPAVASIREAEDGSVTVTAEAVGETVIRATMDESGFTAECSVSVVLLAVSGVTLDKTELSLSLNADGEPAATTQLTATLAPANATNTTLHWSSTDPTVVSVSAGEAVVDSEGKSTVTLTMLKEGRADIVVTAANGAKQAVCHVLVPTKVKSFSFDRSALTLTPDDPSATLIPIFTPADSTSLALHWESSDSSLVTVSDAGVVSIAAGVSYTANELPRTASVTATTQDGSSLTAGCVVTVERNKVTGVALDRASVEMNLTEAAKKTAVLTATVSPASATIPGVTWHSSDETVVTVDSSGQLTAVAPGTATVTVTTADLGYTARCTVTVAPTRVTALAVTSPDNQTLNLNLTDNRSGSVTVELTPHAATDRAVDWSCDNAGIAVISATQTTANEESGTTSVTVSAVGTGTAVVTARAHDNGELLALCTVNVASVPVTGVAVTPAASTLTLGLTVSEASAVLSAHVAPDDATLQGVTWFSSDEEIVTVVPGESGAAVITAHKSGTASITAVSDDGVHSGSCAVTVRWNSTGVEITPDSADIVCGNSLLLSADIITAQSDSTNLSLDWSSADTGVATVDASGRVTAVAVGTTTITASVHEKPEVHAACVITVTLPAAGVALGEGESAVTLSVDETKQLHATVSPAGSTDALIWTSSNSSVASVSTSGLVTALRGGTAVVTAQAGAYTANCTVTVLTPVTGVSVNKTALSLGIGQSDTLSAILAPYDASDRAVSWSVTAGDEFVSVDADTGKVTALKVRQDGSSAAATVTVTTHDGSYSANCAVTVVPTGAVGVAIRKDGAALTDDRLTLNMTDNTTAVLTAVVTPEDATDKSVVWASSNESVATVTDGTVRAAAPGEAVISVTTTSGGHRAVCFLSVEKTAVTAISSLPESVTLSVTDDAQKSTVLTPLTQPANATNKTLLWSVDDPAVVALSAYETAGTAGSSVTVTARTAGTAVITVRAKDDPMNIYAVCEVTIPATPVASVALVSPPEEMNVGATANLSAAVTGDGGTPTNAALHWISSAPDVATAVPLNATTAVVTAVAPGTTTITVEATDGSGVSANCTIHVYAAVTGVSLNKSETTLTIGSNAAESLSATVEPVPGAKQAVTWAVTAGSDVVSVDQSGTITALKAGVATVTAASTANPAAKASCAVTVVQPASGVSVTPTSSDLTVNGSAGTDQVTLSAAVVPEGAEQSVTWSSSNETVATVSANGVVTAHAAGTATITAASVDGKTGTALINVTVLADGVTLDKTALTLEKGRSATLSAAVSPAGLSSGSVAWSSSDDTVAVVDQNGKVTAVAASGTAGITAEINGHTATCVVTASPVRVAGFLTQPAALSLDCGVSGTLSASLAPADAANKTVVWTSADPETVEIVSVSLDSTSGVSTVTVLAHKTGSTTVTAASEEDETILSGCTVTVRPVAATNVHLDMSTLLLYRNAPAGKEAQYPASATLSAAVTPDNKTDSVVWHSTNTGVATVDQSGNVAAVGPGRATILVTAGAMSDQCDVTVEALATGLSLNSGAISVEAGKTCVLTPSFTPANTTNTAVTWVSSDPSVATVTGGVVSALAAGTATITAAAQDGSGVSAACTVTVTAVRVTGVSLAPKTLTLRALDERTLIATIAPAGAAETSVTWSSDDTDVAAVDASGKITAGSKVGTATVTATTVDGGFTADCVVTVLATDVTALTLEKDGAEIDTLTIPYAERATNKPTLVAVAAPVSATNSNVRWHSSNETVATVANGTITAVSPGTAVITAVSESNGAVSAACTVTVSATPVTGVSLSDALLELDPAQTHTLIATVEPAQADNKSVVWTSSNEAVAAVANGAVTAAGEGYAVITATTADGGKTAGCVVHVWTKVTDVTLSKNTLDLGVGASEVLTASISPSLAADKAVTWSSDNETVASVDAAGRVSALAAGTAHITVTTVDQGRTDSCTVTVSNIPVSSVTLSRAALTLNEGGTAAITAAIGPDNATDKTVTWDSSDASVATVTNGVVTALGHGTANITASSGGVTSSPCAVTVYAPAGSVTIKDGENAVSELTLTLVSDAPVDKALTAVVGPDGAEPGVSWSSSNTAVAGVSEAGILTAYAPGVAVVTAVSTADRNVKSTCVVTVVRHTTAIARASVSSVFNAETGTLRFDLSSETRSAELTATLTPLVSSDGVGWSLAGDAGVVQLSSAVLANGVSTVTVYALHTGTATVTATSGGYSADFTVHVTASATGVTLNTAAVTLEKGATHQLTASVLPDDAAQDVAWSTDNSAVASVSDAGLVTAGSTTGTATITASSGGKSASCIVTVTSLLAASVTLTGESSVAVGGTTTLTPLAARSSGTADVSWSWTSSNPLVAAVDEDGTVSALRVGTTQITVTDGVSGKSASMLLSVTPIPLTALTINHETLDLVKNATAALSVTFDPANTTVQDVIWVSSNVSVAAVDENGVVTAADAGTATVTAIAAADRSKTASCTVTVTAPVTGVSLDQTALSLDVGGDAALTASVIPANASVRGVTWDSSDPTVATVSNGTVHALKAGSTTVTVTTVDGGFTGTCVVTVTAPVTGVSLDQTTLSLDVGGTAELTATVVPDAAANKSVTWTSSNETAATVTNGTVTARAAGTAVIFVTTADGGKSAYCTVTVSQKATGISLSATELSLAAGGRGVLSATVAGGASNASVIWTSEDEDIVTVANGVVTAVGAGTATVTAKTADGSELSASCAVSVYAPVASVAIQESGAEVSTLTLNLLAKPSAALSCNADPVSAVITWASSNEAVASVAANGLVTAHKAGYAVITATAVSGGSSKSAACTVVVERNAFSADKSALTLLPTAASGTVSFACASDTTIDWTGDNDAVVQRSDSGFAAGTRTYTFAAQSNGVVVFNWSKAADDLYATASGSVTVVSLPQPLTSVSFGALGSGCALRASLDGDTIRVTGYVDSAVDSYDLSAVLRLTLATDLVSGLHAEYTGSNTLAVKNGDTTLRTYTIDRSGMANLAGVTVSAKTTLIAPEGDTPAQAAISSATADGLKAAAAAKAAEKAAEITSANSLTSVSTELAVQPVAQTTDSLGTTSSLTLDITPMLTVTGTDGSGEAFSTTVALDEVSAPVTIEVTVNFRPTKIVHEHNGALEYPAFTCTDLGNGSYTVSWTQSSFSIVRLLTGPASPDYTVYLAFYSSGGQMLGIRTLTDDSITSLPSDAPAGTAYGKLFKLDANGVPVEAARRIE